MRSFRRAPRRLATALVAVAMVATACSGDDGGDQGDSTPTLVTAAPVGDGSEPTTTSAAPGATDATAVPPGDTAGVDATTTPESGADETTAPPVEQTTAPAGDQPTPTTGDITQTVPDAPQETLAPVALEQPATVGTVELAVDDVEHVQGEARLPGEVAGPALAVHVRLVNHGTAPIDLGDVAVVMTDASGAIAPPLTADPAAPFSGSLAAGASATAVYVFEFGVDRQQPVRIDVSSSAGAPVAVFTGTVS